MKHLNVSFRIWSKIGSLSIFAACILTLMVNITSVYAATPSASIPTSTYVNKQVTKYQLPATLCKQLKAQFPQKASNPDICTGVHTEISTNFIPTRASSAMGPRISNACASGTKYFRESYWDWAQTFSVTLNTNWFWNGTCNIPALTYEDCHIDWTNVATVTQTGCGSYTTNVPSRAALWTGWQQNGPFGTRIWARRECYVNINACNWTTT